MTDHQCERCQERTVDYQLEDQQGSDQMQVCQACFYELIETITNDGIVRLEPKAGRYQAENLSDE